MEANQKFLHGTLEITIFHATPYIPMFPFNGHQILNEGSLINGFFPLEKQNGNRDQDLKLRFMIWFKPAEFEQTWGKILAGGEFQGLRSSSFPLRSNCQVKFYQDAHQSRNFLHSFSSSTLPGKLWEDVYKAIEGARHLVYIAGWSFNPRIVLVRDPETDIPHAMGVMLGDLLKRKAEEGVAVRILIWDDETSLPIIKNKGVMGTNDENAFVYFKHTKVICRLCPRLHHKFPTLFAHHQKTITVDTRVENLRTDREILSFVGGIDLCDGRYDTEKHSLFQSLNTESHWNDFYQTNISKASLDKGGPREPWHDAHASVTGEAAIDILTNFEQRWNKQCDPSLLIPIKNVPNLILERSTPSLSRNWKVQVFRSIDHVSAKNTTVERSIQEAYIEAIRRAEKFIYIENQYFLGGCHLWENDRNSGCRNLIPIEIALKIVRKIKAKERFAVYIVMPMWPEGVPESEPVQDILHWTRETMSMMYRLIGSAIEETGGMSSHHPRDYLNFFCLGNRERQTKNEYVPKHSPHAAATQYFNAQKRRRFMVYVHSKVMIVDDAYILIGSANVNQRSMDGKRDTEIAIGCYQTKHGHHINSIPSDIGAYRKSLWYEHTKCVDEPTFLEPESLECVTKMRSIGNKMWEIYNGEEVVDMEGVHLMCYPINVGENGSVEEINGGRFPDTKAPVKGTRSKLLPPIFTT
ncbi:hypothetical protein ACFE04_008438 [Oxalis oulophora]